MEKIKEFLNSPKKTAFLGFIGAITMLIGMFRINIYSLFYNFYIVGLIVYFSIICMRLYKGKGNIKFANYTLMITYVLFMISNPVITLLEGESLITLIIEMLVFAITIVYFSNILLRNTKLLNNKIFAVSVIGYSIYMLIDMLMFNNIIELYTIIYLVKYIGYIATVPYFYNYYELLKEENKNGK